MQRLLWTKLNGLHMILVSLLWLSSATCGLAAEALPITEADFDNEAAGKDLASKLTLDQCIAIALKNNPDLAMKEHDVNAASAEMDIARGTLWPSVNLVGGYSHYRDDRLISPRREGGSEVLQFTDNLATGGVTLGMPLYMGGQLRNNIRAAEHLVASAKHLNIRTRHELIFNISNVFYSILGQKRVIASLEFSEKTLLEHHNKVENMLKSQKAAKVDLLRTEVRLANIKQHRLRENNTLQIQHYLLASLMGTEPNKNPPEIVGELKYENIPPDLEKRRLAAIGQRQDYLALKEKVAAQNKYLAIANAGHHPRISLQASYGNQWDVDSSENNEIGQVGVAIEIPIFDGWRISAKKRKESSKLMAFEENLRKLSLKIELETETAESNIRSIHARIDVTRKAIEQAKESLRIEREKYDVGKGAIVDVLDAQSELLDAQVNYYHALADYHTALSQFRLATGESQ